MNKLQISVEFDPCTSLYVGVVQGVPGAHSQGASLTELLRNLAQVLDLVKVEWTNTHSMDDASSDFNCLKSVGSKATDTVRTAEKTSALINGKHVDEHDFVELVAPSPAGLPTGTQGVIVHIYPNAEAFEVEFLFQGSYSVELILNDPLCIRAILPE